MSTDLELDSWREQWQAETTVPPNLKAMVERQSRWMKIALLADVAVTVIIGGSVTAWAFRAPEFDIILLACITWLFIAVAWAFALKINHGSWSPVALNTSAFVDLSIKRCRGRLAATAFGAVLYVCEMTFCLAWIRNHVSEPREPLITWLFLDWDPMAFVWLATLAFFAFLLWYRRKKRAELAYLMGLSEAHTRNS